MDLKKEPNCLRCNGKMMCIGKEKIQLGKSGLLTGIWSNLWSGALEVMILICSDCRKIELYGPDQSNNESLPQKKCPKCDVAHDFDYPKCPNCNHVY